METSIPSYSPLSYTGFEPDRQISSLKSATNKIGIVFNFIFDSTAAFVNKDLFTFFNHTYTHKLGNSGFYEISSTANLKKILIGTLGAVALVAGSRFAFDKSLSFALSNKLQYVYNVLPTANLNYFFSNILDSETMVYVVTPVATAFSYTIVPLMNEYFLRGVVYEEFKHWIAPDSSSYCAGAFRILSQGVFQLGVSTLLFSIPVYGVVTIPGMVASFTVGCMLATLREISGDLNSPMLASGFANAYYYSL